MVSFKELKDDSTKDLSREVERLRREVELAEKGYCVGEEAPLSP